jgi:hypothetical protein
MTQAAGNRAEQRRQAKAKAKGLTDAQLAEATDFTKVEFDAMVTDFLANKIGSRIQLGDGTVINDRAGIANVLSGDPMCSEPQRLALEGIANGGYSPPINGGVTPPINPMTGEAMSTIGSDGWQHVGLCSEHHDELRATRKQWWMSFEGVGVAIIEAADLNEAASLSRHLGFNHGQPIAVTEIEGVAFEYIDRLLTHDEFNAATSHLDFGGPCTCGGEHADEHYKRLETLSDDEIFDDVMARNGHPEITAATQRISLDAERGAGTFDTAVAEFARVAKDRTPGARADFDRTTAAHAAHDA